MERFDDYMARWLYGPEGYYSRYRPIGKEGDFYTAVSASPFFGGSIAKRLIADIDAGRLSPHATVCEIGAHHGYLTADVIQFVYTLRPELIGTLRFLIVERHEPLRQAQREYLWASFGEAVTIEHAASLADVRRDEAFVFANEILDAFPARIVDKEREAWVQEHRIVWRDRTDAAGLAGEIAVGYEDFAAELAAAFGRCEFVTFDYGQNYPRGSISMRTYKAHETVPFAEFDDMSGLFGVADITYDVDFSHAIRAFEGAGWRCREYLTQMAALVEFGLADLLAQLEQRVPYEVYFREASKVKVLIAPDGMGERFKMVSFSR